MKPSTSVVAALLGFESLVRGRPQEVRQDETGYLTPFSEALLSGSDNTIGFNEYDDAGVFSGGDDPTDNRISFNPGNSANKDDLDSSDEFQGETSDGGTETFNPQSFDIASGDNPTNIKPEDWTKDQNEMQRLKKGKLTYIIFTTTIETSVVVLKVGGRDPSNPKGVWEKLLADMKVQDYGYAIVSSHGQLIPFQFYLTLTNENHDFLQSQMRLFVDFNIAVFKQNKHEAQIYSEDQYRDFLKSIGEA